MNLNRNIIRKYDDMLYESRPVAFSEFISDKYNNVHNELYNDALNKYFNDFIDTMISSKFIYEYYVSMRNNSDTFDTYYSYIQSSDSNSYINKALSNLGVDSKEFLYKLYNLTCPALDAIKEYIKNKDIITGIKSISDIKDFRIIYVDDVTFIAPENKDDVGYNQTFIEYTISQDSDTNTYRLIEEKAFCSELNDYVFILEEEFGSRIGFNADGELILILDHNDNKYKTVEDILYELNNDLIDEELKEKLINLTNDELNDYIQNSKNDILEYINEKSINLINLYKAIALYEYKSYHKIIEIKNSEYWMPSSIYIISNIKPFKKEYVDLSKYWNMNQSMIDYNIYDIRNTNENILDSELYEINYITGEAKIRSRSLDYEYNVPFKYLDGNINVSDDMTINQTFTAKYNENIINNY